jgi:hypothetical protein
MFQFTWEHVVLLGVMFFFLPYMIYRALVAEKQKRYGKFLHVVVLSLYVLRLAYLRVSTGGGQTTIYDPDVLTFTRELGSTWGFVIATVILCGSVVYMVHDEDKWFANNYVLKPKTSKEGEGSPPQTTAPTIVKSDYFLSFLYVIILLIFSILSLPGGR